VTVNVTQTCFPLLASPRSPTSCLSYYSSLQSLYPQHSQQPLHSTSPMLQLAKVYSPRAASAQVKCTIMRLPYSTALRLPAHKQTAKEEGREPIPLPRRHHAIDLAGSQFPKHRLSGCTRRHSSRHVVRHATRTIPIPNFSLQAKVMEMLECRGLSDSLATRRAALRPRHSTTQHSTATPLTIPDPDSGYFLSFFFFSCSEKKWGSRCRIIMRPSSSGGERFRNQMQDT
jgi:hypothetical protein